MPRVRDRRSVCRSRWGASGRRRLPVVAVAVAAATMMAALAGTAQAAPTNSQCPWVGSTQPIAQRVAQLMSQMTLAQEDFLVEGHGTANEPPSPPPANQYVFSMPGIPSLCIPGMGEEDGPAGVADGLSGVTQLPAGVGLAATFDPSLAEQYGQVIGSEEWGKGAAVNLGPTINIDRDPRWGRSFETFTEDPFLNASLATNEIDGVQSTGEMSQVKHFAAYNQETNRNTPADDVIVDQRTLNEIYFPAFQAAVQQSKAASVMCSYSVVNGDFACQSPFLMNDTLDQEWGYPGFVTSDYAGAPRHDGRRAGGTRPGAAVQHVLRQRARDRRRQRHDPARGAQHDGAADPHPDVPLQPVRQPANRHPDDAGDHPGPSGHRHERRRYVRDASQEHVAHAAAVGESRRHGGGDRPGRVDAADLRRRRKRVRDSRPRL